MKFINYLSLIISLLCLNCFAEEEKTDPQIIQSPRDRYVILKELGEGAFGKVYAVESSSGEKYALKTYKQPAKNGDETESDSSVSFDFLGTLADVEREFKRGQELDHPHIIKSHDFFTATAEDHTLTNYLVLQLVEGKAIYKTEKKHFSHDKTISAAMQFSTALYYAYTMGLYHLDLHTGNVMLSNQADAMVIDLASFFTLKEIFGFVEEQTFTSSNTQKNAPLMAAIAVFEKPQKQQQKNIKLEQFFKKNPVLFKEIQQNLKRSKQSLKNRIAAVQMSRDKAEMRLVIEKFKANYFNRITEICLAIISKSDSLSDKKVQAYTEIKKLAWYYLEGMDERPKSNFDEFLAKLLDVLHLPTDQ
jgi:hypothetical protein